MSRAPSTITKFCRRYTNGSALTKKMREEARRVKGIAYLPYQSDKRPAWKTRQKRSWR